MQIFRYKANSPTGFEIVNVADDYELQKGELAGLPTPCYTPMKLDASGNLVSATLDESNQVAQKYLKDSGLSNNGVSTDQQIATLSKEFAMTMKMQSKTDSSVLTEVAQLKKQVQDMQTQMAAQVSIDNSRAANTSSTTTGEA
ncbi:MAG: hypothetical protein IAA89_00985 [Firmicutes bacterium]|uniref:Uncharacterized protein n=1 Tax=Candidatus Gallilactobacillus intestinavium TaxID=2840838 RepID=A0A9D9H810_9LACO|nr:hypothetical protein [Candidatus Gallilactobacillus intestinavium]